VRKGCSPYPGSKRVDIDLLSAGGDERAAGGGSMV
jgi:hypothetical protein